MGDPKVKLTAAIFEQGQNEGIERAILPLPQLSSVVNARMRKTGRWGKRFGYGPSIASGFSGVTSGPPRCVGSSTDTAFAVVADRCFTYARTATVGYVLPANTDAVSAVTGGSASLRIPGAVSGWLPETSFFPVPARSLKNQTTTPCASCYAFGCLWTAYQYTDPANPTDKLIRIAATDISGQTLVKVFEYAAAVAGGGGLLYPRLVLIGSTLALLYIDAASTTTRGRVLSNINSFFGAEIGVFGGGTLSYDVYPYSSTHCLFVTTYGGNSLTYGLLTTALVPVSTTTFVEVNPITSSSIVGTFGSTIYIGYGITASTLSRVRVYASVGGGLTGTVTLTTASASRPLLSLIPAGGVRALHSATTSGIPNPASFKYSDVSAAAAIGLTITQTGFYPISVPFFAGPSVYVWTVIDTLTGGGARYATMLQLSTAFAGSTACVAPIEMSVQDQLTSFAGFDLLGVPAVTQIAASASYAVPIPTLYSVPSGIATGHDFRIVQAKHYTDSARYRSLQSVFADRSSFVPCGNLTRVDSAGAVEEGFAHPPSIQSVVPAAGGSLTAVSDYYYSVLFKARGANGRYEVSAPSPPVKVTMGVGQTQNTIAITSLCSTQRVVVSMEIYRTLSNTQNFYLAAVVDANLFGGNVVYVDQIADTTIATQQVLYTQVGQTLPNAFPPASRFGCSGGSRLFLGGLIRPDVVQASKLIFGDQSPSFADNDGFRIVLPGACTGLAWCDALVLFTAENIYIASGDGPTDDGIGDFGTLARLPFALGCIEPRSVYACDDGVFFQTSRGLYLLPRGFGAPVAVDAVLDTLGAYPTICGVASLVKATEQTVRWVCANASNQGAQIVYDLAHKVWSVDTLTDPTALGTPAAQYGIGNWYGGEIAMFTSAQTDGVAIKLTHSLFDDDGGAIPMTVRTGDVRPFGPTEQGSVQRLSTLLELRNACTVSVDKVSDRGTAHTATRTYTGIAPDTLPGELSTLLTDLGNTEQRSISSLRVTISESSATEGVALIALALENGAPEGARLNKPADRIV